MSKKKIVITYKQGKEILSDTIENFKFISFERNFVIVSIDANNRSFYKNSIVLKVEESEEK